LGSPVFEQFRRDFFGTDFKSHTEPDLWAITRLEPFERETAEIMLIEGLHENDVRPIIGVGVLRSRKALKPLRRMHRQCSKGYNNNGFWVAQALWRIDEVAQAVPTLLEKLEKADYWSERVIGALALAEVNTPESKAALRKALQDPDSMVRETAKDSLLTLHGFDASVIPISLTSDNPAAIRAAIQQLEHVLSSA
jgi:HEAT repeat protein